MNDRKIIDDYRLQTAFSPEPIQRVGCQQSQTQRKNMMLKPPSILPCVAALLLTVGIAADSLAGEDYRCTIERYSSAEGDSGPTYKMMQGSYLGKQFTVDRSSGVTVGALKNSVDSKPQVVDRGSKVNSYKVVSAASPDEFLPGSIVSALNVMEFVMDRKKPFNFMINDGVFFGTCEHF